MRRRERKKKSWRIREKRKRKKNKAEEEEKRLIKINTLTSCNHEMTKELLTFFKKLSHLPF